MEFSVQAKDNSTAGGIGKSIGTYNRGDLLVFTCNPNDTWSLGKGSELTCNADGLDGKNRRNPQLPINGGTLVGSIDGGNSFFPVGTLCQLTITADNTPVTLYCMDINKNDNTDAITVQVQTK